jgi:hypothetical protein
LNSLFLIFFVSQSDEIQNLDEVGKIFSETSLQSFTAVAKCDFMLNMTTQSKLDLFG